MNIKQITPEYLKAEFQKGKSVKDIAAEHYVSPSAISHIVSRYEKAGLLRPLDRCVIPPTLLSDIRKGVISIYSVEKQSGKSYRYIKRYVDMLDDS
jgi:hypothetical protein